jgi:hypothetical protein
MARNHTVCSHIDRQSVIAGSPDDHRKAETHCTTNTVGLAPDVSEVAPPVIEACNAQQKLYIYILNIISPRISPYFCPPKSPDGMARSARPIHGLIVRGGGGGFQFCLHSPGSPFR